MRFHLLLFVFALVSCQKGDHKEILAKMDAAILYKEDVLKNLPALDSREDSLTFVNQIAESWMREQVLLHEAKKSVYSDKTEELVDQYRNELIIAAFEQNLIAQKVDTLISEQQIEEYIKKENIVINNAEAMVKVKFGKVKSNNPNLEELDKMWEAKKWDDIKDYCATFAEICLLDEQWITLTELQQYFPDKVFDRNVLKKKDSYVQKSYASYEYFLSILDSKEKSNDLSPKKKEQVRKLILLSRAKNILKTYKEELYQSSLDNQKIKFYLN